MTNLYMKSRKGIKLASQGPFPANAQITAFRFKLEFTDVGLNLPENWDFLRAMLARVRQSLKLTNSLRMAEFELRIGWNQKPEEWLASFLAARDYCCRLPWLGAKFRQSVQDGKVLHLLEECCPDPPLWGKDKARYW